MFIVIQLAYVAFLRADVMSSINPDKTEYDNRLQEVLAYDISGVTTKDEIKNFLNKISDWVQFLEDNKTYKKKVSFIYDASLVKRAQEELLKKGDEILKVCKKLLDQANKTLENSGVTLPTGKQVLKKYTVRGVITTFSPTVDESLGWNLDKLNRQLADDAKVGVSEIGGIITDVQRIKWDFDTLGIKPSFTEEQMDQLRQLRGVFNKLNDTYEGKKRYFGYTDFDVIHGIWEKMTDKDLSEKQLSFLFSPAFRLVDENSSGFMRTPTYQEVRASLEAYKAQARAVSMRLQEGEVRKDFVWYKRLFRFVGTSFWSLFKWGANKIPIVS